MNFNILFPRTFLGRIVQHVLFWISVLLLYTFVYGRNQENYKFVFFHLVITMPIIIGATYFTLYFTIPKYLLKKKYKQGIVSFVYTILGTGFIAMAINLSLVLLKTDDFFFEIKSTIPVTSLDVYLRLVGIFIVVFFASSVKLFKYWYSLQRANERLQKEKLEAELNFLKSQVHPHFLFNTLNNLYALTLKKSDQSPEVVLRLSEMLDYMLYECSEEKVLLDKEIKLIENYISLEKLRFGERLKVEIKKSGRFSHKRIAPLILFPFVENAVKHGASSHSKFCLININIELFGQDFKFEIENSKSSANTTNNSRTGKGIGLKNAKKRLELIYTGNHDLQINESDNTFSVTLNINMAARGKDEN